MKIRTSQMVDVHWMLHYGAHSNSVRETRNGLKYVIENGLTYLGSRRGNTLIFKEDKKIGVITNHSITINNQVFNTKAYFESLFEVI